MRKHFVSLTRNAQISAFLIAVAATALFQVIPTAGQILNPIKSTKDAAEKAKQQQQQKLPQAGSASAAAAQQFYWVCTGSYSDQHGSTVKVTSKVFAAPPGMTLAQLHQGNPEWHKTASAWQRYVLPKYSPAQAKQLEDAGYFARGLAQAPLGGCVAGIQADVQGQHDRDVQGGAIEQDWVFTPGQTPPAMPQAAAAAPASPAPVSATPASAAPSSTTPAPMTPPCDPKNYHHQANTHLGPDGCAVANTPPSTTSPSQPKPAQPAAAQINANPPAGPAVVAPAPVSAPRRAATPPRTSLYAYCYGPTVPRAKMYFSAPFEIQSSATQGEVQAFQQFLRERYNVTGGASCIRRPTLEALQQELDQRKQRASQHREIADTGWKFQ